MALQWNLKMSPVPLSAIPTSRDWVVPCRHIARSLLSLC